MVFAGADVVIALQRTEGIFVPGRSLDAGSGIGLALVAMWVDGAAQSDQSEKQTTQQAAPETGPSAGAAALAVSTVATVCRVGGADP
jgi:hypothetical protein